MTTIDPLTYLDEVDARAEAATPGPWVTRGDRISKAVNSLAGPNVVGSARPPDAEFIASARSDLPALSKALRDMLAQADALDAMADEPIGIGAVGSALRLAARGIRQAIQAALAANNEGGKK